MESACYTSGRALSLCARRSPVGASALEPTCACAPGVQSILAFSTGDQTMIMIIMPPAALARVWRRHSKRNWGRSHDEQAATFPPFSFPGMFLISGSSKIISNLI